MITFSIITITYNAEATLLRTVESVLRQTYPHIEHIIVDGASTDDTLGIAKDYLQRSYAAGNGHEVRIISEPDNGLYDAMNKGLKMATGDYVVFMNAGDCYPDPATIEQMVESTQLNTRKPLPAVLYGDTDIVDNDGRLIGHRRLTPPEQLTWRSFRQGMLVCHQSFYARTDIARHITYDLHYRFSADVDWCIRIMKEAERRHLPLVNVHQVITLYTKEGQTTLHHKESLHERYEIMCRHYGYLSTILMHGWFAVRSLFK